MTNLSQQPTPVLEDAILWLNSLSRFGIRPGLSRTQRVLSEFGNPEAQLKFYHVAGTNGKGSVCAFLAELLAVKYKVGVFTSPAFDGYRGRFMVQGRPIPDDQFAELALQVRTVVERLGGDDRLTEFEALTVMAILYFAQHRVEAVVWETGLGGRFDSTNVVTPVVAGITNVSYDHMEILGPTIRSIAYDKAGIIKPGVPIVTAATDDAYLVIQTVAREQNAPLYRRGTHFVSTATRTPGPDGQKMNYRGLSDDLYDLPVSLWGRYQYENASIALAMYELACSLDACPLLSRSEVRRALEKVRWPGRFEVFELGQQHIVLDGAHNPDGARKFAQALAEYSKVNDVPSTDWTMVIGILADKEVQPMLAAILPHAGRVIATAPRSVRAKSATFLAKDIAIERSDLQVTIQPSVKEALQAAWEIKKPIACWGSLYTVDEARKAIQERPDEFAR